MASKSDGMFSCAQTKINALVTACKKGQLDRSITFEVQITLKAFPETVMCEKKTSETLEHCCIRAMSSQ